MTPFNILPAPKIINVFYAVCLHLSLWVCGVSADPFDALLITHTQDLTPIASFHLSTLDGQRIESHTLLGKAVLLNFWATWCGPCKQEMPSLNDLHQQLPTDQFRVLAVTADPHPDAVAAFWRQLGLQFPTLLDKDGDVSQLFMVRNLPTTILIGPDGRLRGKAMGPREWNSKQALALMHALRESS